MITTRTKRQLMVFVLITLIGVSYVGARYARLDRLFLDTSYSVDAHFVDSGGIFTGAEVTYRGVRVGQVSAMHLTRDGVDVVMAIDKGNDTIPRESRALVGNKSAVGEQYVELQPQTNDKPYLVDGSEISQENTEIPVSTTELLTNLDNVVNSVPQDDLRTAVSEMGAAFEGTGRDLGQIIDTSNAFIETADANFDTTTALIRDSNVVLRTQVDKESAIRSFSRDLALFSGTLAGNALSLAAMRATLGEVLTDEAFARMEALAVRFTEGVEGVIAEHDLPWHIVRLGCRAEYLFRPNPAHDGVEAAAGQDEGPAEEGRPGRLDARPVVGRVAIAAAARSALEGAGISIEGEREAVVVDVSSEDRPGKLAELAEKIGAAGVNLAACYVASGSRIVLSSDDAQGLRTAVGA